MRPRCEPFRVVASIFFGRRENQKSGERGLLTLVLARPVVLTLAVGSSIALDQTLSSSATKTGIVVLVGCFIATCVYLLLAEFRLRPTIHLFIQIAIDAFLITALVSATDISNSQFVLLYFILILYASIYSSFRGAVTAAVLSAAGYSLTLWPQMLPWVGSQTGHSVTDAGLKTFFHCALFVTVGLLSGLLARRAEQQDRRLVDATNELHRIKLGTDVILESMGSGIISIDSEGKVVHFNRAASNIFGLDRCDVQDGLFEEVLGPSMPAVSQLLKRGLEEGSVVFRGELEATSADGRRFPLGINTSLIVGESGKTAGVVALCQDLTDVKKTEEKVKRQDTLAAIGEFSAGIAHEIRNCLSPITGSVELLSSELSLEGDSKRLMNLISRETERLDVFLTELLFYARTKALDERVVDLRQLIEETMETVRRHPAHSPGKTILCKFPEVRITAKIDPEQMKRVFVNLAVNALEAIEGHGQLKIITCVEAAAAGSCARQGTAAVVEFEDDGVGIPPETLRRVLEPFYSTKSSGTGLGLCIVQRVVERHGGKLSIESQAGKGTKVKVHIPGFVADSLDKCWQTQKAA